MSDFKSSRNSGGGGEGAMQKTIFYCTFNHGLLGLHGVFFYKLQI